MVVTNGSPDIFPDIYLEGNFGLALIDFLIGLEFNVFGEEICHHGFLLPRLHDEFSHWHQVASIFGFALKHFCQRWLYPGHLLVGLAFASAGGPPSRLPLAIVHHLVGNDLF